MSIAVATLELLDVQGLPTPPPTAAGEPFLVATLANRFVGRTRTLTRTSTSFAFTSEPERWRRALRVESEATLDVTLELWLERDGAEPELLLRIADSVPLNSDAAATTPHTITSGGATLRLELRVVPQSSVCAAAPRAAPGQPPAAVCVDTSVVVRVDFEAMAGVWEHGTPPSVPANEIRSAIPRTSAFGRDGGMIFINRAPNGTWQSLAQFVDLTVRVTTVQGTLVGDADILWTVTVPDDPIVEHPRTRAEAIEQLRSPHHDADFTTSHAARGPTWPGNLGAIIPAEPFEELGHTLARVDARRAKTQIDGGTSRVRLHCPRAAGDRLVIEATVVPRSPPPEFRSIAAISGMLTMWHRLEVDYAQVENAFDLWGGLGAVSAAFEPACFLFEFIHRPTRPIPSPPYAAARGGRLPSTFDSAQFLATNLSSIDDPTARFADDATFFPNVRRPGWFTLGAALMPYPVELPPPGTVPPTPAVVTADLVHRGGQTAIVLPPTVSHRTVQSIRIEWGERGQVLSFDLGHTLRVRGGFAKTVEKVDMTQLFDSSNGFIPRLHRQERLFGPEDYSLLGAVRVQFFDRAAGLVSGISPPRPVRAHKDFFAGRLVIFTWHPRYRDRTTNTPKPDFAANVTQTVAHEFGHSIGTPHKCGHWGFRHGRDSCCMNYFMHAVRRRGAFVPGSIARMSTGFCGHHIAQFRRVILKDNPVFGAW